MTIDELFSLPIHKMAEWMTDNYKDPQGKYVTTGGCPHWFTAIDECFPSLEISEDSGWKTIPVWSGWLDSKRYSSVMEEIKYSGFHTLKFGVTKISKYGECITYVFEGNFFVPNNSRQYKYQLIKITCNNNNADHMYRVYLDGPDVVNNSALAVQYEAHYDDSRDGWIDKYEFIDKYPSVAFKTTPVLSSIYKNKHSINEYIQKFEKFAKGVYEIGRSAYYENKDIVNSADFKKKCKITNLTPAEIFDLWLALYIENQNVTFDDAIGICRLSLSNEERITEYVNKCKCMHIDKGWNDKYTIQTSAYYNPYHVCLLYGKRSYTDTVKFLGYLKDLNKTREFYNSLDGYKNTIKQAKEEYSQKYTEIALAFEKQIRDAYEKIAKELTNAKAEYLKKHADLYEYIHKSYDVNDNDIGVHETLENIIDTLRLDFEKTSIKLMRLEDPSYKANKGKKKHTEETIDESFEELKQHCKKLFDASPDLEKIVYFSVHKAYDGPYEVYLDEDLGDKISEDAVYDYEEKYGQDSFSEWHDKFINLCPYYNNWKSMGDELYPGWSHTYYLDRDLNNGEEDVD